jgi:hypothetical protein
MYLVNCRGYYNAKS